MTMSNAQAALLAAANSAVRGSAVPLEPVLKRAASYLQWLESQDADEDVNLTSIRELHKPEAITQCTAASINYTPCLLASGHLGGHRNSTEGEFWDDKAQPVKVLEVHFIAGPGHKHTVCGKVAGTVHRTGRMDEITCADCRDELGL